VTRALTPVAIAVVVIGVAIAIAAGRGDDASVVPVDARAQEIAAGLRCPVCQNLSVADSPSRLAGEMRAEIVSRLRVGASPDDVRAYFVDRYGAWILLEPPRRGFDLIPWLVPIVGLVAGAAVWVAIVRRRSRPVGDPA
jgi:cytochrome c-type biogenesis protein CcmH